MEHFASTHLREPSISEKFNVGTTATSDREALLTADEVAARLGVGVKWVWAQARAGSIPHVKLGRYRRFRPEAIDRWIAELERRSSA
jgi:excisionase family DNA binding protein